MKQDIVESMDGDVVQLIRHLESGQLERYIVQYAQRHPSFKKDILEFFNPQKPSKTLAAYRKTAASCFAFKAPDRYRKGYDFYAAASEADNKLNALLEKGNYFITNNNFIEAASIAQSIIEVIPRHYELVDDSDGGLAATFNDAVSLLLEIAENKNAAAALKKEIFHWVGREVKENIYDEYGFDEIHSLLIPYTLAAGLFKDALLIADERIKRSADNYNLESAVFAKIHLLQQNNFEEEAESVINDYTTLPGIRKLKIQKMLKQQHYPEAIRLTEEGITVAEKQDHPGTVCDWQDQLLEIYMVMGDQDNIIKYAEDLFYNGRDAMKYYHILKKKKEKEQWVTYLDKLIARHKKNGLSGYPDHVLARIYIEEQHWDRLLHLVEKSDLNTLLEYERYLKPEYPEKVRDLLLEHVQVYAERNISRYHYRQVVRMLKNIRTYPGGDKKVDKLIDEFKLKYKARKAMMEELGRV